MSKALLAAIFPGRPSAPSAGCSATTLQLRTFKRGDVRCPPARHVAWPATRSGGPTDHGIYARPLGFLRQRKKFWLLPVVVASSGSGPDRSPAASAIATFTYTLF
jgi:hypothetical protein